MKKYIILTLLSLSIILTAFASGYTKINSIDYVSKIKKKIRKISSLETHNAILKLCK